MQNFLVILVLSHGNIFAGIVKNTAAISPHAIDQNLRSIAKLHSDVASYYEMGRSPSGFPLGMMLLSKARSSVPAIYINALHHGDEVLSLDAALGLIEFLLDQKAHPRIQKILESSVIYIQPMVNPDGFAMGRRDDAQGIDPNRDYSFPLRSEVDSFQSYASKNIRDFLSLVSVKYAITMHAGSDAVFFPWCYSSIRTSHHERLRQLAQKVAHTMNIKNAVQSYFDYQSQGEFSDYVYMKYSVQSLTLEIGEELNPLGNARDFYVQRTIQGILSFLESSIEDAGNSTPFPKWALQDAAKTQLSSILNP